MNSMNPRPSPQDLYVDRLTKELDRLTQQIALYQSQARVQAEETRAARQAESEVKMESNQVKGQGIDSTASRVLFWRVLFI